MHDLADFRAATRQGKTGLALSGGGFRASLFHIGVLARLAELDLLRNVDVISTVSGGSIIGAYYYLKVKELLEGKRRDRLVPTHKAYIRIVHELEIDFLRAVQKNMRMRTFLDRHKNARMLREGYSPTERMAELYTEHFYAPIQGAQGNIFLKDLPIRPACFPPQEDNVPYKIPQLILNATALNTGHLWQFTGSFVGEEVSRYERHYVEMSPLPKLYFHSPQLTPLQKARLHALTLGQAVAASCCVPGLFAPLCLTDLHKTGSGKEIIVRLVDGGVFDNQGLVSLFAEECTHIICSDASDLLKCEPNPSTQLLNVAIRANEIMMDRIRNKILDNLFTRRPGTYAFFHLGAEVGQNNFPHDPQQFVHALSHIRTDLDSFTDKEAYTLMYYGYCLSGEQFQNPESPSSLWHFLAIQDFLKDEQQRRELLKHLQLGSKQLFKVFFLKKPLPYGIVITTLLFPISITIFLLSLLPPLILSLLALGLLSVVAYSQNARINRYLDKVAALRRARQRLAKALIPLGIPALIGLTGAVITWAHLNIFDRLFLHYGRVKSNTVIVKPKR
jgi:NTE family protein